MSTKRLSLIALILILLLAACGGDSAPEATVESDGVAGETAVTPTIPPDATLPPPIIAEIDETAQESEPATQETTTETEPPTEEAVPEPKGPWPADKFGYGTQVHGNATVGDSGQTMRTVKEQLGLDWVKAQVQWWAIHPSPDADQWFFYDAVVDEAANNDLNLMLSIVGAPEWTRAAGGENGPPDDYAEFAKFLEELLTRYDGKVAAIEVWNEMNLDREWATPNGVNPEDYVQFLKVANETIKAHDPNIMVISGALSPTGPGDWISWADDFEWLDRALAAGLLDYADCVGAHHNGYNIPPDVTAEAAPTHPEAQTAVFRGPFDNPYHLWSFKTTLDTYAEKIKAYDPDKKLCVTEFGWATVEDYDTLPQGFEFAQDNTLQEQADYIVQAYQQMHDSGNVWLAFLFNYDFGNKGGGPTDDPVPYSIIDINGVPRPAFGAVANMEKPD